MSKRIHMICVFKKEEHASFFLNNLYNGGKNRCQKRYMEEEKMNKLVKENGNKSQLF